MKVTDFYKDEYCSYSSYDNIRKIASYIDGQKNASRKILYTIIEKNIKNKIKVSQLGSKAAEYCLAGDTLVNTVDHGLLKIEDMVNQKYDNIRVYCVDANGNKQIGIANHIRFMKNVNELIEIETENGKIECTPDHRLLVKSGQNAVWKEAQHLTQEDEIVRI